MSEFRPSRRTFVSLAAAAAVLPVTLRRAGAADPVTLRVATNDIYGVSATFAANGDNTRPGFVFEKARLTSIPDMLNALRAGQIDAAELGEVGPVVAQAAGTGFKVVAVTTPWRNGEAIIVWKDSPITTIEDLKGKKVAYPNATNAQWLLIKALQSKGLGLKDIESVHLPAGSNLLAALESGVIDATVYIDVPLASYEAQGARAIARPADVGFDSSLQFVASDEAIATKKEAVAAFVNQLARHIAWGQAHPEQRADAIAKILNIDPAVALVAEKRRFTGLRPIDDQVIAGNQEIADTFVRIGLIPEELDVAEVFTTEFNGAISG